MKKNFTFISLAGLLAAFLFALPQAQAAGIGNSPAWIQNDHVLPGMTFEETITVSRTDTMEQKLVLRMEGDAEMIQWISIPEQNDLVFKKDQNVLPMKVVITVPKEAEARKYTADIYGELQSTAAPSLEGGEIGIKLGIHIPVKITVYKENFEEYKIMDAFVGPQKAEGPLFVSLRIKNTGNTTLSQLDGTVQVYNAVQTELLETLDLLPFDEAVAPNEEKTVKMVFHQFIPKTDDYWIAVRTLKDGKMDFEGRYLLANETEIPPPMAVPDSVNPSAESIAEAAAKSAVHGAAPAAEAESGSLYTAIALIALVGVLGAGVYVTVKKNKRNSNKTNEPTNQIM